MRGGYSTSFDAKNDFVLNFHSLAAELRKELKSKMRLKTASTHKESTYGEIQRHKEQIKSLLKNLKTYFQGAVRNMVTGAKVSVSIVNGLLFSREKGEECLEEFIEKQLASREKGFYEPIKRSGIQITIEKKEKPREISILKEDR